MFGLDGEIPTDSEDFEIWLDIAKEHNPVAAVLAEARSQVERVEALRAEYVRRYGKDDVVAGHLSRALDGPSNGGNRPPSTQQEGTST